MDAKVARQLKINLGAVKRLIKEKASYEKELNEIKEKIKNSEADQESFEYKHLIDLREESESMVADCERRVSDFKKKLAVSLKEAEAFPEDPNVIEAKTLLE